MNQFFSITTLFLGFLLLVGDRQAAADVFLLTNGGQIVGNLVNRDETLRKTYVIETADGGQVTLNLSQVKSVDTTRPEELEYEKILPTYPDTAEGQWELAEWCAKHRLPEQRKTHLRRVIEIDPGHAKARHALGYTLINGQWAMRAEVMAQQGLQYYKGGWRTQQEIDAIENKRKNETAQKEWFQKVKLWRGWLGTDREEKAFENFYAIEDAAAVKPLTIWLREEQNPQIRLQIIDVLAKIDSSSAAMELAATAIEDGDREVRLTCLERLQAKPRPKVVDYFVGKLNDKNNDVVNLAGFALGQMKSPASVSALIDHVVTEHKYKIPKAGGDNSTSASFGGRSGSAGSGGMTVGGGPTIERKLISNQDVLNALTAITGQDFGFDKQAWRKWYASQRKFESYDSRRN
jgi:hypothetical protein